MVSAALVLLEIGDGRSICICSYTVIQRGAGAEWYSIKDVCDILSCGHVRCLVVKKHAHMDL